MFRFALLTAGVLLALGALGALGACTSPDSERPSDTADTSAVTRAPDTLTMEAGGPLARRPAAPLRIEEACPFECCTYGTWTTSEPTSVYRQTGDTAAVAFTVPAGTTLEAPTGHVLLTQIGAAVTRDTSRLYRDDGSFRTAAPGDTLLLLDYVGEGTHHTWYADSVYQISLSAQLERLREPESQWWARVETADGRAGWLWMDRTPPVRGVDACGAPAPRDPAPRDEEGVGPEEAVAVVRTYYDAIDAQDYERAYGYWGGDGAASGQTFDEFRNGFAQTASVEVEIGDPGRIEPAAGSRYIEVPVRIQAVTTAGQAQRFRGAYVLRRSVVTGATGEQRQWHLYAADIARDEDFAN